MTSLPIRSVDSAISAASPRAVSDAAIQATAALVPGTGDRGKPLEPRGVDAGGGERLGQPPRLADAEALERLEQRVLGVGGVERRQRALARAARSIASRCIATSSCACVALDPRVDEQPDRRGQHVERLGEIGGGAARGGGRVVELVREPGRHRAERREALAVLLARRDRADTGRTARITRRCTGRWLSASRVKSSASITASRTSVTVRISPREAGLGQRP